MPIGNTGVANYANTAEDSVTDITADGGVCESEVVALYQNLIAMPSTSLAQNNSMSLNIGGE